MERVRTPRLVAAASRDREAAEHFNIATDTLRGHRDASADTACPGANLYAHVTSGDLKRRVDDILAAGLVNLQAICGPEAFAVVADIEAASADC